MKIKHNGVIRDMTEEEIKEYTESMSKEHIEDTPLEVRIAELEEALAMLLSGVTE